MIPTPDRRRYAIIDFGMATLQMDKCTRPEAREAIAQELELWTGKPASRDSAEEPGEPAKKPAQLGGHLIEDFFLTQAKNSKRAPTQPAFFFQTRRFRAGAKNREGAPTEPACFSDPAGFGQSSRSPTTKLSLFIAIIVHESS